MEKQTNIIITAGVLLLLVTVLAGIVSDQTYAKTSKIHIVNETINIASLRGPTADDAVNASLNRTIANEPISWKSTDCPITNFVIRNNNSVALVGAEYTFTASTGKVSLIGGNANLTASNTTYVDYTYCANEYINSGFGRSIADLIPGVFILMIVGATITLFYFIFNKKE